MKKLVLILAGFVSALLMSSCGSSDKEADNVQVAPPTNLSVQPTERSTGFNASVDDLVNAYSSIKDAFVEADAAMVKSSAESLIKKVESLDTNEIKKDTLMYEMIKMNLGNLKDNVRSMITQKDITEMRRDFSGLSESMYSFLRSIKYKGPTLYFQNCPMAFNDNEPANWLSKSPQVLNPYLGKKHPKYKAGMLHCGEIVDSIISKP